MSKILVTGGGKGMGAAIVSALVADGFDVTFTVRSSLKEGAALASQLMATHQGREVTVETLDCADKQAIFAFAEKASEQGYYGFVHNAGATYDQLAAIMEQDKAESVMQVNFFAFAALAKALVRPMSRAKAGRIIAIGSVTALRGSQGNAAYAASKAAILGYIQTLAIESARRGITVNYIAPGFVDTDMMSPYENYRATMEKQIPLQRFAKPDEIGHYVSFLCSQKAGYITGSTLTIDGGLTASMGIQR